MGSHFKGTTEIEALRREAFTEAKRPLAERRLKLVLPLSAVDDQVGAIHITCARCCAIDLYRAPVFSPAFILCRNCGFAETPFPSGT
jgi:hypothetical protein